jgi:hypothetical protein
MEPLPDTPLGEIEARLRHQLAHDGSAHVSADALAEAICARCHEEVRVWAENFARSEGAVAEEDAAQAWFVFRRA